MCAYARDGMRQGVGAPRVLHQLNRSDNPLRAPGSGGESLLNILFNATDLLQGTILDGQLGVQASGVSLVCLMFC
jgi:hypothetical protein